MKCSWLKDALESDMDVKVISVACPHSWSLSPEEKQNLRTTLRADQV